jgi:polar amino acid transport system substrate-binding protein
MRQVFQNPKTGETKVDEVTSPVLGRGGVLVRNHFSVVSPGTERSIIELSRKSLLQKAKERPDYVAKFFRTVQTKGLGSAWRAAQAKLGAEIALGYASAGEVIAVGDGVKEFKVGDRVACAGQGYASHAEVVFVPKNLCVKIPADVSEENAAFATLGAIALQGIRQANLLPGDKVAVVGLGLLGQLAVRLLQSYGHPVAGFDIDPRQIKFAKDNGLMAGGVIGKDDISKIISKFTDGRGADAVLVYASSKTSEPLKLAVSLARDRGRIVQIGSVAAEIPWREFYEKELSFFSSRSYGPGRYDKNYEERGEDYPLSYVRWTEKRNLEEFLRLIGAGKLNIQNLVTRIFDINEAAKAYDLVLRPKEIIHGLVLAYPRELKDESVFSLPKPPKELPAVSGTINIGLIGIGAFMKGTILPELKKMDGIKIKAVCDSRGLESKKTGLDLGAEYTTSDYRKIIEDKGIDLIICTTRHSSHALIVREALIAGKNVYVEKPLALDEKDLREVIKAAAGSKGRLLVGFNRRFSPHFSAIREEFSGKNPLQILYRVNAGPLDEKSWIYDESEGGRMIGEGCHFADALNFLTGAKPLRVWASAIPVKGSIKHLENFTFTVEYEDGSQGTVVYSALGNFRWPKEYMEVFGGDKVAIMEDFKKAAIVGSRKTAHLNYWKQKKGYSEEIRSFIQAIKNGKPSPMSLQSILYSHLVIYGVKRSLETGEAARIDAGKV